MIKYFIGDVHGRFSTYYPMLRKLDGPSIQLGDMGLGFGIDTRCPLYDGSENPVSGHYFIRGNHDDPEICRAQKSYLGDYGIFDNIFFISGAYSIDKKYRTIGVDWWEDEEMNLQELDGAITLYKETKPETVVSHDCPFDVIGHVISGECFSASRTAMALSQMLSCHRPRMWIFGHYHRDLIFTHNGTIFVSVGTLSVFDGKKFI